MNKMLSLPRAPASLRGADLPLLVSLNVLLEECSVTRAAERLNVSQPALSAQLSRLRTLFDDPLLVPAESGRGLAPSPFARKLHRRLQPALTVLTKAVRPLSEVFDPQHTARTFTVVANGSGAAAIVPHLARTLHAYGNRELRLRVLEFDDRDLAAKLEKGEIDLCLSAACLLPPGLSSSELMTTPHMLVQRDGHPRGPAPVSLEEYERLDHVNVVRDSSLHGAIDVQLYRLGAARHSAIAVRDFSAVGAIVAASDLVGTIPAFLVPTMPAGLQVVPLAFPLLTYTLCMAWHPGCDDDPDLRWLRDQVSALGAREALA